MSETVCWPNLEFKQGLCKECKAPIAYMQANGIDICLEARVIGILCRMCADMLMAAGTSTFLVLAEMEHQKEMLKRKSLLSGEDYLSA